MRRASYGSASQPSPIRLELAAAEQGAIAQLGERLLCKQEVVGSIPSGSTSGSQSGFEWFVRKQLYSRAADAAGEFSDIVKRRSLRAAGEMKISCAAQSPASGYAS